MCKRENTPFVLITVVNSCRVNPFSNSGGKLISTKPDKHAHGFGTKSIKSVCKKYNGDIQMYYNEESLTFHTVITIRSLAQQKIFLFCFLAIFHVWHKFCTKTVLTGTTLRFSLSLYYATI
ncbi:GHKL domain-containing protein [Waltera sp.]|uniref:GHKL domain-containing protein n=1 Tax=Waltera sp. TaxID=2815806 RepID=UPI0039A1E9C9